MQASGRPLETHLPGGRPEGAYNLKEDLSEKKDLAAAQPDVVARLTKLMQHYIANGRSTPGAPQKNAVPVALDGGKGGKAGKVRQRASAEPE